MWCGCGVTRVSSNCAAASGPISARSGDMWIDHEGEHISVVYADEQVLAVDLALSEFVIEQFAGDMQF